MYLIHVPHVCASLLHLVRGGQQHIRLCLRGGSIGAGQVDPAHAHQQEQHRQSQVSRARGGVGVGVRTRASMESVWFIWACSRASRLEVMSVC